MVFDILSHSNKACNRTNHVPDKLSSPWILVLCNREGVLFNNVQKIISSVFVGLSPIYTDEPVKSAAPTTPDPADLSRCSGNNKIRKVASTNIITTVAGTGSYGFTGDGGQATSALLDSANGLAVDSVGNISCVDVIPNLRYLITNNFINTI
jgi:hypothetical protein